MRERKRVQKWLKPKRLNVLASDEAGVHQEWGELGNNPDCFENSATGTALAAPIKRATWFYPLHDPSNGETLWTTRVEGDFGRVAEASPLSDVQERMKWALRARATIIIHC